MNEPLRIALMLPAGMLLGALFFGGLWWTVQKGLESAQPALWFGASLLLRGAIVLAGFYLFAGPHWQRLLACLLGFIAARVAVNRLAAKRMPKGASHAP
ncbi:MAG: ATP synthase subunit I [Gallionella sp.]